MTAPPFAELLESTEVHDDGDTIAVRRDRVGDLVLRTGRIAAADPLIPYNVCKFTRAVPPGKYPVDMVILTLPLGDELCAAAVLRVGSGTVARWEPAECEPDEEGETEDAYSVDSATGCFVDAVYYSDEGDGLSDEETFYDEFVEAMDEASGDEPCQRLVYPLNADDGLNIVAFMTGHGDGAYRSWWGLDKAGKPVMLVTDFNVWGEDEDGGDEDEEEDDDE